MKTNVKDLATILAAAIWADETFDDAEQIALDEIQDALELNKEEFEAAMQAELDAMENASEDEVNARLQKACDAIDDNEVGPVYECAMQIVVADGIVKRDEVNTLLVIADMLSIDDADAMILLLDMVKNDEDVTVEVD